MVGTDKCLLDKGVMGVQDFRALPASLSFPPAPSKLSWNSATGESFLCFLLSCRCSGRGKMSGLCGSARLTQGVRSWGGVS